MNVIDELMNQPGVLAAGEFSHRGDGYSYQGLLDEDQARMVAVMCRANSLVVHMQADILGNYERASGALEPRGWVVRGGHFTVCVMGKTFCFLENEGALLNEILTFLRTNVPAVRTGLV